MSFVRAARKSEIPEGQGLTVDVDGRKVALFSVDGKVYAIGSTCLHRGGPLGEGHLEEKMVTCPWHAWRFDVTTGQSEIDPSAKVPTYPVKVQGDDVLVEV